MSDGAISVRGGAGGIGARLDDMRTEAGSLEVMASDLLTAAQGAAKIATDPDLLESAVLSPVTALRAEESIAFATAQLVLFVTEAGADAVFLEGAVIAYETVDRSLAALATVENNAETFVIGLFAVPLAIGAGILALEDIAAVYVGGYGRAAVESIARGAEAAAPMILSGNLSTGLVLGVAVAGSSFDQKEAQSRVDHFLTKQLQDLNKLAGSAGLVDFIAGGAPGLLNGLVAGLLAPVYLALGPAGSLFGLADTNLIMTKLTGVPWPPRSYEDAVKAIIGAGNRVGLFNDALLPDSPDGQYNSYILNNNPTPIPSTYDLHGKAVAARAPQSVSELFTGSGQIDREDMIGDRTNAFARIRIVSVPGPPTHYIVQIPSTQVWSPDAGATPNDVTADTHAMINQKTVLYDAVVAAMTAANISRTDPVMLEGFSLGGIVAAQMAADPHLGYNITHCVTAGAPIAQFDIPSKVSVLAYEYDQDPVAQLDGADNPDRANWLTVTADAPRMGAEKSDPGLMEDGAHHLSGAHNADRYALTAAHSADNRSVAAYSESASGFFADKGTIQDFGAVRNR